MPRNPSYPSNCAWESSARVPSAASAASLEMPSNFRCQQLVLHLVSRAMILRTLHLLLPIACGVLLFRKGPHGTRIQLREVEDLTADDVDEGWQATETQNVAACPPHIADI